MNLLAFTAFSDRQRHPYFMRARKLNTASDVGLILPGGTTWPDSQTADIAFISPMSLVLKEANLVGGILTGAADALVSWMTELAGKTITL